VQRAKGSASALLGTTLNSPQAFGPYELTERINIGGMAEVFRAQDHAHQRLVAIKRILPSVAEDEEFIQMFRDEAAIASQLDHPNIAKIYDVGKVDLSYYLALEFVNGKDLRVLFDRAVRSKEPIPLDFIIYVMRQAAEGLDYAHHRMDALGKPLGVVHRDVSPQNLLVSFDGDVKIIDFGIAKAAGKLTRTQVGTIKGKFGYMSPEQVRGLPVDQRSDVFSLGICLWELIGLERLFTGDNEIVIMEKIRSCEIPSLAGKASNVPPELEKIVLKALAKDADERYATAKELSIDLEGFARAAELVADRGRAAEYMRRVFAGDPAINASIEEKSSMADRKSGSDLDVFEGLSKKTAQDEAPTPFAPPTSGNSRPVPTPLARHKTLLGMPNPPGFPPVGSKMPSGSTLPGGTGAPKSFGPPPLRNTGNIPPPPPGRGTYPSNPASPPPGSLAAVAPDDEIPTAKPSLGSPNAAPALPTARALANSSDVEMDWDEEDEKTSVFERSETTTVYEKGEATPSASGLPKPLPAPPPLSALVPPMGTRTRPGAGQSSVPPPPMGHGGYGSRFPPPPPPVAGRLPSVTPPGALGSTMPRGLASTRIVAHELDRGSVTSVISTPDFRASRRSKVVVGIIGGVLVAGIVFLATQRGGKVAVFVAGPGGKPLSSLTVLVDGMPKCTASPCNLELDKGIHAIKATSDGYAPQEQGATVHAGEEIAINFKLEKTSEGTGLKVGGKQDGVELFIDGKEIGPLPQEVKDLAAGPHKLLFKGNDRYEPEERTVNIDPEQLKDLGPISLKVLRGLATFDVRTPGVRVTLASGKDRRQLTDFSQPVEIETSKNWTIEATKPGYDDMKQPITFDDRAEKTFVIALQERTRPLEAPAPVAAPPPRPIERAAPERTAERAAPERAGPSEEGSGGNCTLNFNSIPVSNVVFDGRPLGGTPKLGYSASPGSHTVIFINADEGKKVTSVTCRAGETKTVAVRLSQ